MPIHESTDPVSLSATCSPPGRSASELRAGAILHGTNGSMWIAARRADLANAQNAAKSDGASQGDQWLLYSTSGCEESLYWVHDNGNRPFLVRVTPFVFAVYAKDKNIAHGTEEHICGPDLKLPFKLKDDFGHPRLYPKLVAGSIPYLKLWAAHCPKQPEDDYGLGNSLLVQLSARAHMTIGREISVFDLAEGEVVQDYQSPIGNNDVPYPYIITNFATYLTIEDFDLIPISERDVTIEDPYRQYYDFLHPPRKESTTDGPSETEPRPDWPHPSLPIVIVCKRQW